MSILRKVVCLFFAISFTLANAQNTSETSPKKPDKKSYTTQAIGTVNAPAIDGILDDPAWDLVPWATDFVEWEPDNGTPPSEQTKFKIVYDDKNIYFAFRCEDSEPDKIERRLSRRDGFAGDWVEVNIDSYNDDRTAFSFTITAAGVKGDEFISNNGNNWDSSWNPIWYVKTQIDDKGWIAEFRIPLSQLRFGNDPDQVWGIQAHRRFFREAERSLWQPVLPNSPGWVSEFGELRGLKNLKPQKQLEIQPYVVTQLDTYEKEEGNPYRDGNDTRFTGGLDAKIGITNDLTLDVTINPDFGQVDADPGAITLDGFEIFFQERRPFFVENKNIFDFRFGGGQDNLFFSRRIGRSPQGSGYDDTAEYVDQPTYTTILGAAKFSGKTQNGWSLGVLESITSKEYATITDESGEEREKLVEPLTNYLVGRVQKDFNNRNSYIGGIFTSTNRKIEPDVSFLRENAYSGGIDFRHNWKDREFHVLGTAIFSSVHGSKEAITATQESITHLFQRVDASHVEVDPNRTSLEGTGGKLQFGKSGGGNWRYTVGGTWRSPELELNDIGFLRQADEIRQYANVSRLFAKPTSWYRRARLRLEQFSSFDFEGNYNRIQYEFNGDINYKNNWWSELGYGHKPRIYINSTLRGGPRWRYSEENFFYTFTGTDQRKRLSVTLGYVHSDAKEDNFNLRRYVVRLNYRPFNALSLSLNTEYENNPNKTQYVTQQDNAGTMRYIMAEIDQEILSTTLRVNYTINPNLTIQYYAQPFIARGRYSNFNYVNDPVAESLSERVTWYTNDQIASVDDGYDIDENLDGETDYSFSDPDFAYVQFRSNLVLRWEYIPGSELFLVWSQGITGFGDASNDFNTIIDNQLYSQKPENNYLLKATYRFIF